MAKQATLESQVPEIRFRPTPEVYAKAIEIADNLGLTLTDVARMGLAQLAHARELRLVRAETPQPVLLADMPVHGVSVSRIAAIASAAARAADDIHVQAGRLPHSTPGQTDNES